MKLAICCNHSHPATGGSEIVIQNIAERLFCANGVDSTIFSTSIKKEITHNNVTYSPLEINYNSFTEQINNKQFNHLFIYSDYFKYWPNIVTNPDSIICKKSIALVGMNNMFTHRYLLRYFANCKDKVAAITHSDDYQDYLECNRLNVPVSVIKNGVDLDEFNNSSIDFRLKYKIDKNTPVLLCVANFFPGKGQEHLLEIADILKTKYKQDFILVFIYSTTGIPVVDDIAEKIKREASYCGFKVKFLKDISREDTVAAFKNTDLFVFASQKEVSPLVILESMAAKTTWVSTPVGNVPSLSGGIVVPLVAKDRTGNVKYGIDEYQLFAKTIYEALQNKELLVENGENGYKFVKENHNWDIICQQYYKVFNGS